MSKRQLEQFLKELKRKELESQVLDLYQRFKSVKEFYDFSFNPNEVKRFELSKSKIGKEYFPEGKRKPKKRVSVAQKEITQLINLEADPERIADLMLFNLEIAQTFCAETPVKSDAFYRSMLKSFRHALVYIENQFLQESFKHRIARIVEEANRQNWFNSDGFSLAVKSLF
tara:strand:+ start:535 stop:1047 length:513 start_codon:yes stop_codon:yes gene_type:complete